jgi:prophage regulatory protein
MLPLVKFEVDAAGKVTLKRAIVAATLANLPPDLGRNRVLDAAAAAAFWGVSLPHRRRLYRTGKVPPPIKVGERKLGWRVGVLVDALVARDAQTAA